MTPMNWRNGSMPNEEERTDGRASFNKRLRLFIDSFSLGPIPANVAVLTAFTFCVTLSEPAIVGHASDARRYRRYTITTRETKLKLNEIKSGQYEHDDDGAIGP